jgi:phosphatidate cytidylyltransferase
VTPLDMAERGASPNTKPNTPEIAKRIASAVVLGALALAAVIASPWTFAALVIASGVTVAWEWGRLVRGTSFDGIAMIQAAAVAAIAAFLNLSRPDLALVAAAAALIGTGALGLSSRNTLGWSLLGLAYSVLPAWCLVWLRSDETWGATALLYLFAVAWTTDTASFAGGKLIGGARFAPKISPRKTWSGLIIGTLTPALVGYGFAVALDTSPWQLVLVSIAIAAACQVGDLSESAVKRRFGAKDMSNLIPGHGGLLDRIDGLLIAAIAAAMIALRDPAAPGHGLLIW